VHGLGGNVLNLRSLALALGPAWAFVGIQASGVDGIRPLHRSMDEICEAYLAELRAYHPGGPYLLAGYSNGGLIAYELAQRLEAADEAVGAVVLLDTIHPSHADSRIPLRTHLSELRRRGPVYVVERVLERRQRAARHASDAMLDRYVDVPGVPAPWEVRERRLFAHNKALLSRYRPARYEGRVVMMSATDDWKYQHLPADRGWSVVVPHIEVVRTSGDHVTLLEGPNAAVLADGLRPVIERILADR
jgi:thioesterase domain-containing protein